MTLIELTTTLKKNINFEKGEIIKNDKKNIITDIYAYQANVTVYNMNTNQESVKKLRDCNPDEDLLIQGPFEYVILELKYINDNELK